MKTNEVVAEIINSWDPVGLLAGGAPRNEYSIEIKEISNQITLTTYETELAKIIYRTFIDKMGIKLNPLSCLKCAFRMNQELMNKRL